METQSTTKTLSASRFPAAMGISPYTSRKKLWRLMTGREQPASHNQAMAWGKHNEWRAVAAVEALTGVIFDCTGDHQKKVYVNGLAATPDGVSGEVGLEVKCPEKVYDEIPAHYMAQIQGQILVCGFALVYFGCWGNTFLRCWEVPRSGEYVAAMLSLLEEFAGYVDRDEEPPRLPRKPVLPQVTCRLLTGS